MKKTLFVMTLCAITALFSGCWKKKDNADGTSTPPSTNAPVMTDEKTIKVASLDTGNSAPSNNGENNNREMDDALIKGDNNRENNRENNTEESTADKQKNPLEEMNKEVGDIKDEVGDIKDEVGDIKDEVGNINDEVDGVKDATNELEAEIKDNKGKEKKNNRKDRQ
ncbi:MAG: hypothetical protein FJX00_01220 [Alphaproteobacteria bacterium]|nr:hypothetical protein [Alphaproteobacteria bacterium]